MRGSGMARVGTARRSEARVAHDHHLATGQFLMSHDVADISAEREIGSGDFSVGL